MIKKDNRKIINAWAFYDWANSAYPLVITTAIFPLFFQNVACHFTENVDGKILDYVHFLGFNFINTELYSYVFSFSFLIVAFLSPLLSGVADVSGRKKFFLQLFCYLGAASCSMLYFFDAAYLELSMLFVFLASIGFWASLVFYNAYLPEIASNHLQDKVSAKGFALGYIGSSILLIANLVAIQAFQMPAKYAFLTVGLWWAGFAQYTYRVIPENIYDRKPIKRDLFTKGFKELKNVWNELGELSNLKRFLRSFFVYSMGVQTVMLMAVLFAKKEIDWQGQGDAGLIISVLIIQFIAAIGAYFFAAMSNKFGNRIILAIVIMIWILVCITAYYIHTPMQFYILAAVVGFVMGGIQSLSRSTYSKMLPKTKDHASFFSFYDVLEKIGIVIGTFLFGFIEGLTSSMRNSALVLLVFFAIGFVLLMVVKDEENISAVKN